MWNHLECFLKKCRTFLQRTHNHHIINSFRAQRQKTSQFIPKAIKLVLKPDKDNTNKENYKVWINRENYSRIVGKDGMGKAEERADELKTEIIGL